MTLAEECLQRAAECEELARTAKPDEAKFDYRQVARLWREMAEQADLLHTFSTQTRIS